MKNFIKIICVLALSLCAAVFACACEAPAEKGNTGASVTVTDMKGREITLDSPAQRIVALSPSDCEILFAIGAGDRLVGRGEFCDYPPQAAEIPLVGTGENTNVEQIIALEPDLLLMNEMAQTKEQAAMMESAGIKVVVSNARDIKGVYTDIEMIGRLLGKEKNAAAAVENMKAAFTEMSEKARKNEARTVYFEVSPLKYGLWTAGSGTFMDEVAEILNLKNCFGDVQGWAEISEEQVLERDPDFIVTLTKYSGDGPTPEEELLSRKGWQNVSAIKNRKILNLQNDELSRPSPRLSDGAKLMFDFVYGK